jgi:hypothetical protein
MAPTSAFDESLIKTITATLNERMAQLKSELVAIAGELLTNSPEISSKIGLAAEDTGARSFVGVIDTVRSLLPLVPATAAQLQQMLYGIEDTYALIDSFIRALSSSTNPNEAMKFEVSDRKTGKGLLVTLPPAAYPYLAEDIDKRLRKLKRLRKKILGG